MPRIERSIEIDAPPDQVLDYVSKPENQQNWVSFLREYQVSPMEGSEGTLIERSVVQIGPRKEEIRAVSKRATPSQALSGESTFSSFAMDSHISVASVGDMAEVTWTIDYTPPMGKIGLLGDMMVMRRLFINEVEKSLENLKEQLEAPVA